MCGIAGIVTANGDRVDEAVLHRMCAAIEHRGPDSRGTHAAADVALGIQRLRVIDLETGDQPIYNEDRSVVVVLNGEIYNYRELREGLLERGHTLRTKGDTEVIVHLYEELGPRCVEQLHGMFAFALWDIPRNQLLVARDRLGKKPLFYHHGSGRFSFASELPALLSDPQVPRRPNPQALDAYMAHRYVPSPLCAFEGIRKLPPAHRLILRGDALTVERYWSLQYEPKLELSDAEAHERIRDGIRRATRKRMISDVPLGAFLSGGVDSAAVVAAMAESSSEPIKTFSIGFESEAFNELPLARLVAQRFGTDHHEFVVRPDAMAIVPQIVRHFGEPFGDASAIPSFYVAEMARAQVTVALNGDGGDESFAGYTRYVSQSLLSRLDRIPAGLRRLAATHADRLPRSGQIDSWTSRVRRVAATADLTPVDRYVMYAARLNRLDRDLLYTPEWRGQMNGSVAEDVIRQPWTASTAEHIVDRMLDVDVQTHLPDDLLAKIDIATMAHSLEGRSPLLDHEFMQFAASLPVRFKLRGRTTKAGFRAALRGWVPDEILDAPKRGFRLPVSDWLRQGGELEPLAREVLQDGAATARGMFQPAYVGRLLDEHAQGRDDHAQGIWSLLMFELWHREFVD